MGKNPVEVQIFLLTKQWFQLFSDGSITKDTSHLFLVFPAREYLDIYQFGGFWCHGKGISNTPGELSCCVTQESLGWGPLSIGLSQALPFAWGFLYKVRIYEGFFFWKKSKFAWSKRNIPDMRQWGWRREAEDVRPPLPLCCFSVFSCGRKEFSEDFFLLNTY